MIRVGGGRYYGDGQIGISFKAFHLQRRQPFQPVAATTPGLAYPVDLNPDEALGTAPYETERFRKSETYQQWTAQIQQRLPWGFTSQVGYTGMESHHLAMQNVQDNLINPGTGQRTLPSFDQVSFWSTGKSPALMD